MSRPTWTLRTPGEAKGREGTLHCLALGIKDAGLGLDQDPGAHQWLFVPRCASTQALNGSPVTRS